jgi:hypothetical protein
LPDVVSGGGGGGTPAIATDAVPRIARDTARMATDLAWTG